MTIPREAYDELLQISHELALLNSIDAVVDWDQEVNMPPKGAPWRAEQSSYLSGTIHRKFTDPRVGELLATAEAGDFSTDPLSDEAVNLREWRHSYDRQSKVPTELVEELTRTAVIAQGHWAEARKKAEFSLFAPDLKKLIDLVRQQADYIGYEETPYDALLDAFEPGEKTANVQRIFAALRDDLVPLVQAIAESSKQPRTEILHREYPADRQRILGEGASAAIGLDYTASRLDISTHPFSTNFGPGDQRITTRYNTRFFNESFFGTLHETGHALYEQNLPLEAYGTPRGNSVSLGIHESQSRTWENFVGRSRAFWRFYFPRTQQMFPAVLSDVSMEDFYFALNEVKPSYIRVEADEITYNLHIMLRFEIEQAIISGDLQVDDIPGAWNELLKITWASRFQTMARAVCRTSTGPLVDSATSRLMRWAISTAHSSSPKPARTCPIWTSQSLRASSNRCWIGCAPTSTARVCAIAPAIWCSISPVTPSAMNPWSLICEPNLVSCTICSQAVVWSRSRAVVRSVSQSPRHPVTLSPCHLVSHPLPTPSLTPIPWREVTNLQVGFELWRYIFFEDIAGHVHQRVTIIAVDAHAGQTGIMVMHESGLLLGVLH